MIQSLIGPITGLVKDWFKRRADKAEAKHERELRQQAEAAHEEMQQEKCLKNQLINKGPQRPDTKTNHHWPSKFEQSLPLHLVK